MKVNEVIKDLMKKEGVSAAEMGRRIGKEGKTVTKRLLTENMTINSITECLDVLGYEVAIQKRQTGRKRDSQIVLKSERKKVQS